MRLLKIQKEMGTIGIGKAEKLRGNLSGYWSRRIDDKNRLIYTLKDDKVDIFSCRGHYDDK